MSGHGSTVNWTLGSEGHATFNYWCAVKELKLSYSTITWKPLFSIYPCYGNVDPRHDIPILW